MELLLPMAAKKLDMSFNIEPDVPQCLSNVSSSPFLHLFCPRGDGR